MIHRSAVHDQILVVRKGLPKHAPDAVLDMGGRVQGDRHDAEEGACQFLFLKGEGEPEISYADRGGKYMGQRGVTLPKL